MEKSVFNNFSVDTESENFKELLNSVKLVGIKDPVLARFNPEGKLTISVAAEMSALKPKTQESVLHQLRYHSDTLQPKQIYQPAHQPLVDSCSMCQYWGPKEM